MFVVLQGKGLPVNQLEDERQQIEILQSQVAQDAGKIRQLESTVEEKDATIRRMTQQSMSEEGSSIENRQLVDSNLTLTAMIEAKVSMDLFFRI